MTQYVIHLISFLKSTSKFVWSKPYNHFEYFNSQCLEIVTVLKEIFLYLEVLETLTVYHCILYEGIFQDAYFFVQGLQMTNPYMRRANWDLKNA